MTDEDRRDEETDEGDEPEAEAAEAQPEAEAEPEAEPEPKPEPESAADDQAEWTPPPPDDLNVFDMLRAAIGLFVQEAWIALGVQARPGTTEVHTDLHGARIAIDTTHLLIEKLGDEATAEEKREFEQIMTNLRMNFVRRQAKQG